MLGLKLNHVSKTTELADTDNWLNIYLQTIIIIIVIIMIIIIYGSLASAAI